MIWAELLASVPLDTDVCLTPVSIRCPVFPPQSPFSSALVFLMATEYLTEFHTLITLSAVVSSAQAFTFARRFNPALSIHSAQIMLGISLGCRTILVQYHQFVAAESREIVMLLMRT